MDIRAAAPPLTRALVVLVLCFCTVSGQGGEPPPVSPGHSAHWYQPARSGEGWVLEVLNPESALLYWFTYDEQGEQRWLMDLGEIRENQIIFSELRRPHGGRFGPDFDPDDVAREIVGEAVMALADCDTGTFEYSAFGQSQVIEIQRFTRTAALACGEFSDDDPDPRAGLSGSWYDRSHSGEGYTLQWMTNGRAVLVWFTYDTQGNQYWIIGVGDVEGKEIVVSDLHATRGARFGEDFDRDDVERFEWGELRLDLGCTAGDASYQSDISEFGGGSFNLSRLARLDTLDCDLDEPGPIPELDLDNAQWLLRSDSGPQLSELPAVSVGDAIYVGGGLYSLSANSLEFWRYRPASNQWSRLADLPAARDHAMMAAYDGKVYLFGGYRVPIGSPSDSAWRYDPAADRWDILDNMPASMAAGGAAVLDGRIYVMGMFAGSMYRYDPVTAVWSMVPVGDTVPRDHSALVAYDGELWLLGGRDHVTGSTHNQVSVFDPTSGALRTGPPMRSSRSGFAATVLDGHIVAAGGERFNPIGIVSTAEVYNPHTGEWQSVASPPVAVHGAGAAVVDGKVYMILGSTVPGNIVNPGHVQVLEIPEG